MSTCIAPPVGEGGPTFSYHSRGRMRELHITDAMVRDALDAPLTTQPCDPRYQNNAVIYTGEAIRVVVDPMNRTVITVHLRTRIPYQHGVHHLGNLPEQRQDKN